MELKALFNPDTFGALLCSTGERLIVAQSQHDGFWGAASDGQGQLRGRNMLGRLLMELRATLRASGGRLTRVDPPAVPGFPLAGVGVGAGVGRASVWVGTGTAQRRFVVPRERAVAVAQGEAFLLQRRGDLMPIYLSARCEAAYMHLEREDGRGMISGPANRVAALLNRPDPGLARRRVTSLA